VIRVKSVIVFLVVLLIIGCDYIIPDVDFKKRQSGKKIKPVEVNTDAIVAQGEQLKTLFETQYKPLEYNNKKNPFVSVIDVYKENLAGGASVGDNPLENVELEQIRLTGSLSGEVGNVGVVQVGDQVFYVKEGDKIGKNSGVIIGITPNEMKIRQVETDIFGNIRTVIKEIKIVNKEDNL
jgi:Tfp pilus assembly protein PilP